MLPFSTEGDADGAGGLVSGGSTAPSFLFFITGVGLIAQRRSIKKQQHNQGQDGA